MEEDCVRSHSRLERIQLSAARRLPKLIFSPEGSEKLFTHHHTGRIMEGNKKANPSSRDLISTLPDDVLCYILSFLTTKEAALTHVLSKRWSNLLQLVPILDFDDSLLLNRRMGREQTKVFMEFVERVLFARVKNSSPVKKASFKLSHLDLHERFDRVPLWVKRVMDLGASELCLSFGGDFKYVSFVLLYSDLKSKALVNLRIGRVYLIHHDGTFPDSVSHTLTTLFLDSVQFTYGKPGFEAILSAFPNLQNLRLHESKEWYYWDGSVSSPTLKRFVYRRDDDTSGPKPCVKFDTPGLAYLEYSDVVAAKYENLRLDSLVEARLDLLLTAGQIMRKNAPDNVGFVPGDVSTLFKGIRHVKILCLSPDALDTLYYRGGEIPVFNNLISLSLGSDRPHGSPYIFKKLLPSLLLKAPNLQTLIIKGLGHYVKKGWEVGWHLRLSLDDMYDALSSSGLKVLQINGYEGTGEELSHMERFLGTLPHLEMVRVTHKGVDDGERRRLVNDLLCLTRASPKCKVQVMKESA
ncbi:hypothetical protein Bca52824_047516 [Brassica carinata]|uniref:FBD domain-containing protein n=1 Tax=Brassica carinata TaxID=52824 RepID=A0A8X7URC8_BRACI|nr:hypothetical protein Bca52824_047516 [Brassica carinata]